MKLDSVGFMDLLREELEDYIKVGKQLGVVSELQTSSPTSKGDQKARTIHLPIIRLSEKMWGKEGTADRSVLNTLLKRVIQKGSGLRDKIAKIGEFLEEEPKKGANISDVLTHIVLLDTMTNILLHFGASSAGFTFEGFLAALLEGEQVGVSSGGGIQDIVDNDKNPISLKLLSGKDGEVKGSFKDLVNHFVDPSGEKQDPKSEKFLQKAGAKGTMKYFIALKPFGDIGSEEALKSTTPQPIKFYMFDFNAQNFLDVMASSTSNGNLLLLPKEAKLAKKLGRPKKDPGFEYDPKDYTDEGKSIVNAWLKGSSTTPGGWKGYNYAVENYTEDYFYKIMAGTKLKWKDKDEKSSLLYNQKGEPMPWAKLKPNPGGPELKQMARKSAKDHFDFKQSEKSLRNTLKNKGEQAFWNAMSTTNGYTGGGDTQFHIPKSFYGKDQFDEEKGYGFIGQINVGKGAITAMAEKYTEVLSEEVYEIYDKLEDFSNLLNKYFVAGEKTAGLKAISASEDLTTKTTEFEKKKMIKEQEG